jgi:hypothetical protein
VGEEDGWEGEEGRGLLKLEGANWEASEVERVVVYRGWKGWLLRQRLMKRMARVARALVAMADNSRIHV